MYTLIFCIDYTKTGIGANGNSPPPLFFVVLYDLGDVFIPEMKYKSSKKGGRWAMKKLYFLNVFARFKFLPPPPLERGN